MTRTFIETRIFTKRWQELGLTDKELLSLQRTLLRNPDAGIVMQGTGGIRKVRISFEHRGKSGSARVCYVDFAVYERIYLLTVFAKSEQENLSDQEKAVLKKLVGQLRKEAAASEGRKG